MYALTGEGRADYHRTQAIESVESIMKREDAPQKVAVANVHLRILQIEQSKRKNSASRSSHFDNQTVEKDDDGDTIVEDHIERYNLILRAISHGRTNDEAVAELAPDLHKKRMDRSSDGSSNTKDT